MQSKKNSDLGGSLQMCHNRFHTYRRIIEAHMPSNNNDNDNNNNNNNNN